MRRRIIIAERFCGGVKQEAMRSGRGSWSNCRLPSARETAESKSFFFFSCCLTRSFSSSVVPAQPPPSSSSVFWRRSTASWKRKKMFSGRLPHQLLPLVRPFFFSAHFQLLLLLLLDDGRDDGHGGAVPGKHNHPHSSFHFRLFIFYERKCCTGRG